MQPKSIKVSVLIRKQTFTVLTVTDLYDYVMPEGVDKEVLSYAHMSPIVALGNYKANLPQLIEHKSNKNQNIYLFSQKLSRHH